MTKFRDSEYGGELPHPHHNPLPPGILVLEQYQASAQHEHALDVPKKVSTIIHTDHIEDGRLFNGIISQLHEFTGLGQESVFGVVHQQGTRYISSDLVYLNQVSPYSFSLPRVRQVSSRIEHFLNTEGNALDYSLYRVHSPSLQWDEDSRWFLANRTLKIVGWLCGIRTVSTIDFGVPDTMTQSLRHQHFGQDLDRAEYEEYMARHRSIISGHCLQRYGRDNIISVRTMGYAPGTMTARVPKYGQYSGDIIGYTSLEKKTSFEKPFTAEEFSTVQDMLFQFNTQLTIRVGELAEVTHNPPWGLGLGISYDEMSHEEMDRLNKAMYFQEEVLPEQFNWVKQLHRTRNYRPYRKGGA